MMELKCARCGKESFEDSMVSIIEKGELNDKGLANYKDYCFNCGMEELKTKLKGVPITIEVPYYPEYTGEELCRYGAAINYTAELIDFPPHK